APAPIRSPAQKQGFDGHKLYKIAFEALRDNHIALADDAVRAKWVSQWQDSHARDGVLETESGADRAISEMLASLAQPYGAYLDPARTRAEKERQDSKIAGIGIVYQLKGLAALLRSLPRPLTAGDIKRVLVVSRGHPIVVREVL